jgi:hypothetical protein
MSSIIAILVRATLFLCKTLLLVGILALLAPLWCLVLACILLFIAFLLRLVHCSGVMLGRTVDSDQFQGLVFASVVELMLGSRWYDNDITGFDILFYSSQLLFLSHFTPKPRSVGLHTCSFPATTALPVPEVKINT